MFFFNTLEFHGPTGHFILAPADGCWVGLLPISFEEKKCGRGANFFFLGWGPNSLCILFFWKTKNISIYFFLGGGGIIFFIAAGGQIFLVSKKHDRRTDTQTLLKFNIDFYSIWVIPC